MIGFIPATALPQVFWDWTLWRDKGGIPSQRPLSVTKYIRTHPGGIPAAWWVRYRIHRGYKPPTPPPIPVPVAGYSNASDAHLYRYAAICAEAPWMIASIPNKYSAWLTVDPAYDQPRRIADSLREKRLVGCWGNPAQLPPGRFYEFADKMGIPHNMIMGQAETSYEFQLSQEMGLRVVVGNLSALTAAQLEVVRQGNMLFIQEDYWNVMPWLQQDFRNVTPVSMCHGIYPGQSDSPTYGSYKSPNDYIMAGRWHDWDGFYHANGPASAGHPEDLQQLP